MVFDYNIIFTCTALIVGALIGGIIGFFIGKDSPKSRILQIKTDRNTDRFKLIVPI